LDPEDIKDLPDDIKEIINSYAELGTTVVDVSNQKLGYGKTEGFGRGLLNHKDRLQSDFDKIIPLLDQIDPENKGASEETVRSFSLADRHLAQLIKGFLASQDIKLKEKISPDNPELYEKTKAENDTIREVAENLLDVRNALADKAGIPAITVDELEWKKPKGETPALREKRAKLNKGQSVSANLKSKDRKDQLKVKPSKMNLGELKYAFATEYNRSSQYKTKADRSRFFQIWNRLVDIKKGDPEADLGPKGNEFFETWIEKYAAGRKFVEDNKTYAEKQAKGSTPRQTRQRASAKKKKKKIKPYQENSSKLVEEKLEELSDDEVNEDVYNKILELLEEGQRIANAEEYKEFYESDEDRPNAPHQVISGGQMGADIAGLAAAAVAKLRTWGYAPAGFRTEKGDAVELQKAFYLTPTDSRNYDDRTKENADNAHGTIVFVKPYEDEDNISSGSLKAIKAARKGKNKLEEPMIIELDQSSNEDDIEAIINELSDFLKRLSEKKPNYVLNIAGNRETGNPKLDLKVLEVLVPLFTEAVHPSVRQEVEEKEEAKPRRRSGLGGARKAAGEGKGKGKGKAGLRAARGSTSGTGNKSGLGGSRKKTAAKKKTTAKKARKILVDKETGEQVFKGGMFYEINEGDASEAVENEGIKTTFEAVNKGLKTSTTRPERKNDPYWADLKVGDKIRFSSERNGQGNYVFVEVTSEPIDLSEVYDDWTDEQAQEWADKEGWTLDFLEDTFNEALDSESQAVIQFDFEIIEGGLETEEKTENAKEAPKEEASEEKTEYAEEEGVFAFANIPDNGNTKNGEYTLSHIMADFKAQEYIWGGYDSKGKGIAARVDFNKEILETSLGNKAKLDDLHDHPVLEDLDKLFQEPIADIIYELAANEAPKNIEEFNEIKERILEPFEDVIPQDEEVEEAPKPRVRRRRKKTPSTEDAIKERFNNLLNNVKVPDLTEDDLNFLLDELELRQSLLVDKNGNLKDPGSEEIFIDNRRLIADFKKELADRTNPPEEEASKPGGRRRRKKKATPAKETPKVNLNSVTVTDENNKPIKVKAALDANRAAQDFISNLLKGKC
jgi:hypothetical protein